MIFNEEVFCFVEQPRVAKTAYSLCLENISTF